MRDSVVDFLSLLDAHPTGSKFVASLNRFHKLAFSRLAHERGIKLAQAGGLEYNHVTGKMVGVKHPGKGGKEPYGQGASAEFIASRTTGQGGFGMPVGYVHAGAQGAVPLGHARQKSASSTGSARRTASRGEGQGQGQGFESPFLPMQMHA